MRKVYVYTKFGEEFARSHNLDERLENHLAYIGRIPLHMCFGIGGEWASKGYVKLVPEDEVIGIVTNENREI